MPSKNLCAKSNGHSAKSRFFLCLFVDTIATMTVLWVEIDQTKQLINIDGPKYVIIKVAVVAGALVLVATTTIQR